MTCRIHFYLLNDHFSQEYADQHNDGNESEMNRKYQWEDELAINVAHTDIEVIENGKYVLQGTLPDEKPFQHEIESMRLFNVVNDSEVIAQLACSESTLDSFELSGNEEKVLKVYLKGEEPLSNPVTGIYIAAQEFPKELIF